MDEPGPKVVQTGEALSGFGRVPDDFEQWIEPIMDKATQYSERYSGVT